MSTEERVCGKCGFAVLTKFIGKRFTCPLCFKNEKVSTARACQTEGCDNTTATYCDGKPAKFCSACISNHKGVTFATSSCTKVVDGEICGKTLGKYPDGKPKKFCKDCSIAFEAMKAAKQ